MTEPKGYSPERFTQSYKQHCMNRWDGGEIALPLKVSDWLDFYAWHHEIIVKNPEAAAEIKARVIDRIVDLLTKGQFNDTYSAGYQQIPALSDIMTDPRVLGAKLLFSESTTSVNELTEGTIAVGSHTQASTGHPDRNEDAFINAGDNGLFIVCDGLTNPAGGEVAAKIAAAYLSEKLQQPPRQKTIGGWFDHIIKNLVGANKAVSAEKRGSTTVTLAKVVRDNKGANWAIIGWVGDSRVYLFTAAGELHQLTCDDVRRNDYPDSLQSKAIQRRYNDIERIDELTTNEKRNYYQRSLIQALGMRRINPNCIVVQLPPGSRLILTSDGIHEPLTSRSIVNELKKNSDSIVAASALGTAAFTAMAAYANAGDNNLRGKPHDDGTVIIAQPA